MTSQPFSLLVRTAVNLNKTRRHSVSTSAIVIAAAALSVVFAQAADGALFYSIADVTSDTAATDFFSASNLIEGPGDGFDASAPHNRTSSDTWVTNAPNGGSGDYFGPTPSPGPRLVFDLGTDRLLSEISVWGYSDTTGNGVRTFDLRFATESDGSGGFGTSILLNPSFTITQPVTPRQSLSYSSVFARYVELTPTDNFFGHGPGGDRVGLGEVAFQVVPEPATFSMGLVGLLGLVARRRRVRR